MQLTIEVLPAPLGPMIENNSPSFTPKLTSASARTPPKRSDTPRTSKACSTHSLHWRLFRIFQPEYAQSIQGVLHALFLAAAGSASRTLARQDPPPYSTMGGRSRDLGLGKSYFCIFRAGLPRTASLSLSSAGVPSNTMQPWPIT